MVVFFNATATTEIYTYLHTLSLHDALPILLHPLLLQVDADHQVHVSEHQLVDRLDQHGAAPPRRRRAPARLEQIQHQGRSEEHTSELQSLMRISYAVFCLKKKKINQPVRTKSHSNHKTNTAKKQRSP